MTIEDRIREIGGYLPAEAKVPAGVTIGFAWARVYGDRVFVSGHAPLGPDGIVLGPFGRVGDEVTPEQATEAARLAALSAIASVKRAVGSLDRVTAWLRVEGFVLTAPGFEGTTNIVNGASRLIIDAFGDEIGRHARTAMGVASTPLRCSVVIAAEVAFARP